MKNKIKLIKILLISFFALIGVYQSVLAQVFNNGVVYYVECGDLLSCLIRYAYFFINLLLVIVFLLSVGYLIWAGILYVSQGGGDKAQEIHKMVIYAIVGLVVSFLALTISLTVVRTILFKPELQPPQLETNFQVQVYQINQG